MLRSEDPADPLMLEASVTLDADGGYTVQTVTRSEDAAIRAVLLGAGFQAAPGGLSRIDRGHPGG